MVNINNPETSPVLLRSKTLTGYSRFVNMVRDRMDQGILRDFFEKYGGEVANKMFKEYTLEDIVRIRSEEAREEGIEEGAREKLIDQIKGS